MFEKIEYGFHDIYGIKWSDAQVDLYNKVSAEILQREQEGFPVSDEMLDNRHRIYQLPLYNRKKGETDAKISRRRNVCVTFENGNSLETAINGTKEEIEKYYIGRYFNVGGEPLTKAKSIIFTR